MNTSVESLTHKMQRAAVGKMVDVVLSHADKDRQKTVGQLVDVAKQFYGSSFSAEAYEHARQTLTDPDSKWSKLINCVLDQTDPNVARTMALNLGYEAFFRGTKKIQIEGRVLGDLAMNHIVPIASKYEAQLLDKVYKMHQIGGLNASSDILLIKKIQDHTASIQKLTGEMIDARKVANRIEDPREKAIAYHDTVAVCFDEIRRHIDKLEEIVDDQIWPLPKYRELLFLR